MEITDLRQKFKEFFSKAGYKPQNSSSLIPENDPSVLFTTAGMQQFKDFYLHPADAPAPKLLTVQPVIRTSDITEVGDDTHLTMFEMLGIFSFGEQDSTTMKRQAIGQMWQFIHEVMGVEKNRVYATIFGGDHELPEDVSAQHLWAELSVPTKKMGRDDNFWGPTGDEGPCGPTSEIFIDDVEVGNLVFNQYYQSADKKLRLLDTYGLDFGSGLERLSATLQGKTSVWQIKPFSQWLELLDQNKQRESRVIIDHLRASIFLISADIRPANKGREYVLRRLIRKTTFLASQQKEPVDWAKLIEEIRSFYVAQYHLEKTATILEIINKEKEQFEKNLNRAMRYLEGWLSAHTDKDQEQITKLAFYMYESFGFPKELVIEHLQSLGWQVDEKHFAALFEQHQQVSRAGLDKQFKGGLADHQPMTIKHHTAHHLLLAALQQVLGPSVVQRGSNVTSERLRMDFAFDRKLTEQELKKVELIVNEKIKEDLPVTRVEMSKDEALKSGAQAEFGQKYGDIVSVYSIGNFSKELCGGPHIAHTGELGQFEILKEEASSQGIRRIKARVK